MKRAYLVPILEYISNLKGIVIFVFRPVCPATTVVIISGRFVRVFIFRRFVVRVPKYPRY